MGLFGGTSRAAILNYDKTCKLLCFLCTNNFRNFLVVPLYELRFLSGCFGSVAKINHLWSCFTVHSCGFSRGKIAPGTSSASHIHVFFLLITPSILLFWAVLTPLKHSTLLSAMFVYIHVLPNNPINACVPSFGPRLLLFSQVSYYGS